MPAAGADAVLADLDANGQAAVVFARPEDDRACQVKGTFVGARPASDDEERPMVRRQCRTASCASSRMIGIPGESSRTWVVWPAVAVRLRVDGRLRPDAGAEGRDGADVSLGLEALAPCFQGLIPATLFTCSADGIPNAAYLSHVDYVDPAHVALSFQFFNKSRRNIAENPTALVQVVDPDTQQGWELRLRLRAVGDRRGQSSSAWRCASRRSPPTAGSRASSSCCAADIYEVLSVRKVPEQPGVPAAERPRRAPDAVFTMKALQDLAVRLNAPRALEPVLDSILAGLERALRLPRTR